MANPYRIEGPALVSFSGGRTSAYMLRMILDAHDGVLPDDAYVCFANTGKERWRDQDGHDDDLRKEVADVFAYMTPQDLLNTVAFKQLVFVEKMQARADLAQRILAGD